MYPISHCAKMYFNGSSRLAGIGAPKHGCRVSSEGSRRASALCKAPAVSRCAAVRPPPLYRGGSGLVARHPADAEKNRDVANCNFRHAAISPLRSNLDVWGCILRRRKVHYFNAFPGRRQFVLATAIHTVRRNAAAAAPPTSIAHLELFY